MTSKCHTSPTSVSCTSSEVISFGTPIITKLSPQSEDPKDYLVIRINKPMACLDPQTPQQGVLANKTAGIQGFVEANLLETRFRVGVYLSQSPSTIHFPDSHSHALALNPNISPSASGIHPSLEASTLKTPNQAEI
jgi:hypothetical protein